MVNAKFLWNLVDQSLNFAHTLVILLQYHCGGVGELLNIMDNTERTTLHIRQWCVFNHRRCHVSRNKCWHRRSFPPIATTFQDDSLLSEFIIMPITWSIFNYSHCDNLISLWELIKYCWIEAQLNVYLCIYSMPHSLKACFCQSWDLVCLTVSPARSEIGRVRLENVS